jgi:hypothetical protein
MSRWAYPASQALADVSKHGSLEAAREARALIKEEDEEERAAARINAIRTDGPRRMLDLFSGTGSVGEVFKEQGWEVISLDSNPACKADFTQDILEWDYKQFPRGHFQVIAAGIPCTEFSRALTTRPRDLQKGDELALKTLEIIDYFHPQFWYIENPRHGLLSTRPYMTGIPFIDVDYCQFSDWGYQKPTRIWGSVNAGWHKDIKCDGRTCPNLDLQAWVVGTNPRRHHRELLGGNHLSVSPAKKGRWPCKLVAFLMGWDEAAKQVGDNNPAEAGRHPGGIRGAARRQLEHPAGFTVQRGSGWSTRRDSRGGAAAAREPGVIHGTSECDAPFPPAADRLCPDSDENFVGLNQKRRQLEPLEEPLGGLHDKPSAAGQHYLYAEVNFVGSNQNPPQQNSHIESLCNKEGRGEWVVLVFRRLKEGEAKSDGQILSPDSEGGAGASYWSEVPEKFKGGGGIM